MKATDSPLMQQYFSIKAQNPDTVLLFRVGDFYETYGEDARTASQILGIVLTKRSPQEGSIELAGFPHHAIDTYLPKLVRAGCRVAICEQLEDPKLTKKLVKRGVTELVTPGVVLNDHVLENKRNNFLASVSRSKNGYGISLLDISTGEYLLAQGDSGSIEKILVHFSPNEILIERTSQGEFKETFGNKYFLTPLEDWAFHAETAREKLMDHFKVSTLKGFGIDQMSEGISAAGSILQYLDMTKHADTAHISTISRIDQSEFVSMDKFTLRNLELLYSGNENGRSLIDTIDFTISPMGGRLLRRWISLPLKDIEKINERLSATETLFADETLCENIRQLLEETGDMERIISKIAVRRASPRDLLQLSKGIRAAHRIKKAVRQAAENCTAMAQVTASMNGCDEVAKRISHDIAENAPVLVSKGHYIADGVSAELDELRSLHDHSTQYLLDLQNRESQRAGIPSLKVNFNNVFGYYIEVRNTYKDKVPSDWIRKQTLVNAERYITQELKEYEQKILTAEDRIATLESSIYNALLDDLIPHLASMQQIAHAIGTIDCLQSYATAARKYNYHKPNINESTAIQIQEGRHPVIEQLLPPSMPYIANDIRLDDKNQQMLMITGPNMSGKSALLRQTALIVLMAQAGSFVPAEHAEIGIVDRIFTRVGASDNLSQGESTFMVEMMESANILNNLTARSLILLDEIGRGTSTYDGISIAWAMAEFLHESPGHPKTLFATHYHELSSMEQSFSRIKNYHIATKEVGNKVIFLRKLARGGSEHSFGIHVAQMAGMPKSVVNRAQAILKTLEKDASPKDFAGKQMHSLAENRTGYQLSIFQMDDPVLSQIRDLLLELDINNMTPLEALNKLQYIKELIGIRK